MYLKSIVKRWLKIGEKGLEDAFLSLTKPFLDRSLWRGPSWKTKSDWIKNKKTINFHFSFWTPLNPGTCWCCWLFVPVKRAIRGRILNSDDWVFSQKINIFKEFPKQTVICLADKVGPQLQVQNQWSSFF